MLQIQVLKSAVKEQRATAVTEITGRAPVKDVSEEDLQARLASVNAAVRTCTHLHPDKRTCRFLSPRHMHCLV